MDGFPTADFGCFWIPFRFQFWHHQVPGLRFHYPPTTSFLHRSNPTACTPPTFSPLLPPATTCNISPSHTLNPSSPTSCHPHPSHLRTLPPLLSFKYQAVGGGLEGEAHFLYRIYNRTRKVLWELCRFSLGVMYPFSGNLLGPIPWPFEVAAPRNDHTGSKMF